MKDHTKYLWLEPPFLAIPPETISKGRKSTATSCVLLFTPETVQKDLVIDGFESHCEIKEGQDGYITSKIIDRCDQCYMLHSDLKPD